MAANAATTRNILVAAAVGLAVAGCGSAGGTHPAGLAATPMATATPAATEPTPTATPTPTAVPTPVPPLADHGAPPLRGFTLGYDPVSRRLILHGGLDSAYHDVSQTWAWDGRDWTRLQPATELPPQASASMAVDPASGHLLLMGGDAFSENSDNTPSWSPNLGTWLWDGATWQRVADNPRQGGFPALAVDEATHQLVVNSPDIRGVVTTDDLEAGGPAWYGLGTYSWTGSAWASTPSDSSVDVHALQSAAAYDPISRRVIQFGGVAQNPVGETLAWDGSTWTRLSPATAPTMGFAFAATDPVEGQIVMVTANPEHRDLAATWTWDGRNWVRHIVNEPPSAPVAAGANGQMVWDPAISRVVLAFTQSGGALQLWTWEGVDSGWERVPS